MKIWFQNRRTKWKKQDPVQQKIDTNKLKSSTVKDCHNEKQSHSDSIATELSEIGSNDVFKDEIGDITDSNQECDSTAIDYQMTVVKKSLNSNLHNETLMQFNSSDTKKS